jgi:hypothetical protein
MIFALSHPVAIAPMFQSVQPTHAPVGPQKKVTPALQKKSPFIPLTNISPIVYSFYMIKFILSIRNL